MALPCIHETQPAGRAAASTPPEEEIESEDAKRDALSQRRNHPVLPLSPAPTPSTLSSNYGALNSARSTGWARGDWDDDPDLDPCSDSLPFSIRTHVFEGGLRYHAFQAGRYALPNDENEQNRDEMKHAMTLMLCRNKRFYAPVEAALKRGAQCIDLGTGTGLWAIEMGDEYPNATITGIDLSPIQPDFVPENVQFFIDDFEQDWVDAENKFDFIHVRHTLFSIKDVPGLLRRIYKHLKPGGYVEFQEMHYSAQCDDASMTPTTPYALRDFLRYMTDGLHALGSDLNAILSLPAALADAGLEDVTVTTHKCPIGEWARDRRLQMCGMFLRSAIMDGLPGLCRRPFSTGLGWKQLQIEMFLVDVRKAVVDDRFHTYFPFHAVYARKPLA